MIVLILFWIIYCVTEGYEDAWYPNTNHWRAALRRIATGIIVTYGTCGVGEAWVLYANTGFLLGSTFLVFFNISRNLADSQPWHYVGKTASWDKVARKLSPVFVWGVYFILMILSIIVQCYNSTYTVHADFLINTTWHF